MMELEKKLSICIPTYNRCDHLNNCLNSIYINNINSSDVEVCISDNNSTDKTFDIVSKYKKKINIKYNKNSENIGVAKNILKSVDMSTSKFCWIIGDDDLLINDAIKTVLYLLDKHKKTDYFFINSFHLDSKVIGNYKSPINPVLIKENMSKFSNKLENFECDFVDLINPNISFDYFGGMYLSVFNRLKWDENTHKLDLDKINNKTLFSNLDNTFPHVKVFSYAFKSSKAFFYSRPLTINLYGVREWVSLYPLIRSIRIVNSLDLFFANGLIPLNKYLKFKNLSLQYFIPDILKILLNMKNTYPYIIEIIVFYIKNFYYPNIYLSVLYQLKRLIKKLL